MSLTLTVIGCGSATPVGHRLSSAFVLRHNRQVFMIDCGEGAQMYLKENHIHMQRIQHILISHLHGDHYFGLVGLLSSMHLFGRDYPLTVYAPPELEHIVRYQLEVGQTELSYPLRFVSLTGEEAFRIFDDKGLEVSAFPLQHGLPAYGFVFKEKTRPGGLNPARSFAYCSDTVYTESILPHIQGVDLLYHESTFLESERNLAEKRLHSTAHQAAMLAQKAGVGKLLLGHYSARYADIQAFQAEAGEIFPQVELAREGLQLTI